MENEGRDMQYSGVEGGAVGSAIVGIMDSGG